MVEVGACRLCGSTDWAARFREGVHEVRRCADCGLVWVSPRRDEAGLQALYGEEQYWRSDSPKECGYADYRADAERYLETFRLRLDRALRGGPHSGRALDVGCAAGYCLRVLADRGFAVDGVELSPVIAREARARLGEDAVHVGTVETSPHAPGSFDLITLWDVVEHVVDPHALLRRARELLAPGGLLVLETQDVDSPFARLLGRRWHHFKHAEHLYHFSPVTIRRLLADCGFRVEELTHRHAGKHVSGEFVAERSGRVHPALPRLLGPLGRLGSVYVNVFDEMLVLARTA